MQSSKKRRILSSAAAVAVSALMAFAVSAETTKNVTLSVSTDKQSYSQGEQVSVSVSAFNGTDKKLENIVITESVPLGFQLAESHSLSLTQATHASGGLI